MAELCRVLLGVRLVVAVLAVLLLAGTNARDAAFIVALVFAIATSTLAFIFWRQIAETLRRHPLLLSVDTIIAFFVFTFGDRAGPFLLFTVVTSAIAGLLYKVGGMLYIVGLQEICYLSATIYETAGQSFAEMQPLLAAAPYYPLVGFAGLWVRRLLDGASESDEARRLAEVAAAADRERTRLARDMHDSLTKTVRGIAFAATALPNWIDKNPTRAKEEAGKLITAAEVASREARDLLTELRSGSVDQPLPRALQEVCDGWARRADIELETHLDPDADLAVEARYEMVSVLREALSNVERHARASTVTVWLTTEGGSVVLAVTDDGIGFDSHEVEALVTAGHYGLLGMTERGVRASGKVVVTSSPGAGSTVTMSVPVMNSDHETKATRTAPETIAPTEAPMESG